MKKLLLFILFLSTLTISAQIDPFLSRYDPVTNSSKVIRKQPIRKNPIFITTGYVKRYDGWHTVKLKYTYNDEGNYYVIAYNSSGYWSTVKSALMELQSFDPYSKYFNYKVYILGEIIYL